jgi:Flp pilus assembly pilin Flp
MMRSLLCDETGASAVEYAVLVGLIAAVVVAAVALLGTAVLNAYQAPMNTLP